MMMSFFNSISVKPRISFIKVIIFLLCVLICMAGARGGASEKPILSPCWMNFPSDSCEADACAKACTKLGYQEILNGQNVPQMVHICRDDTECRCSMQASAALISKRWIPRDHLISYYTCAIYAPDHLVASDPQSCNNYCVNAGYTPSASTDDDDDDEPPIFNLFFMSEDCCCGGRPVIISVNQILLALDQPVLDEDEEGTPPI